LALDGEQVTTRSHRAVVLGQPRGEAPDLVEIVSDGSRPLPWSESVQDSTRAAFAALGPGTGRVRTSALDDIRGCARSCGVLWLKAL
jgi:hypothetical protein